MSSIRVVARTISEIADEEEWALDWMGTRSVFDATRPEEIERVFAEKLQGRTTRFGKSVDLNVGYRTPRERQMLKDMKIVKIHNISRAQTEIRDLRPDIGPSRRSEGAEDDEESDLNSGDKCGDDSDKRDDGDDDYNDDPSGNIIPPPSEATQKNDSDKPSNSSSSHNSGDKNDGREATIDQPPNEEDDSPKTDHIEIVPDNSQ